MRYLHFTLSAVLLLGSGAAGFAQTCKAPAQTCAAGPNGWGGCYVPGPAQCFSGMICESGASACPPGKNGEGACYDPRTARCDQGTLAANSGPPPRVDQAAPSPAQSPAADGATAGGGCHTASGEERAAVLDTLRAPVSSNLKTTVEFAVERVRICGDWAFVIATPRKKGGGAIRLAGTVCAGDTSHLAGGLMRRSGTAWSLVEYALCPSDVAWSDWPEKFNAPQALFD